MIVLLLYGMDVVVMVVIYWNFLYFNKEWFVGGIGGYGEVVIRW